MPNKNPHGCGMRCPQCGLRDSSVTETRATKQGLRRRRTCSCGRKYTTVELVVAEGAFANGQVLLLLQPKVANQLIEAMHTLECELMDAADSAQGRVK